MDLDKIRDYQRKFVAERDWERFHSPKNLTTALVVEAGELAEVFQWLTEDESRSVMSEPDKARRVEDEVADVFNYILRLTDVLKIDLEAAVWRKLHDNALKYPVRLAKGNAKKYTEF